MSPEKIRLGVIGANATRGWAPRAHLPAILASHDFALTAVCTTRQETAEESARQYGARFAFHDYREMLACPDIDAIAVVVRVPSHYEPTRAALKAGKHVFTEWPLGANTEEAQELAELARQQGVQTSVGLQSRASPAVLYLKELVEIGYIGEVLSCHMSLMRSGVLQRQSDRTWQRDVRLGATTLTIATGHSIDALRFVVGNFSHVTSVVTTQAPQWLEVDTGRLLDVTAPDNILVSGRLMNGAVASVHVASIPWAGSAYRMEIYGREGTLVATSDDSPQLGEVRVQAAKAGNDLVDLVVPSHHIFVPEAMPPGTPYNIGQLYALFAQAIRSGEVFPGYPDFDLAVDLHRLIDAIGTSSNQRCEVAVPRSPSGSKTLSGYEA